MLNNKQVRSVVRRNYIAIKRDSLYPAWLPLAFNRSTEDADDDLIPSICALPAVQFDYPATSVGLNTGDEYSTLISKKMSSAQHSRSSDTNEAPVEKTEV